MGKTNFLLWSCCCTLDTCGLSSDLFSTIPLALFSEEGPSDDPGRTPCAVDSSMSLLFRQFTCSDVSKRGQCLQSRCLVAS
eukprot:3078081-Amphidinium_carterae.1